MSRARGLPRLLSLVLILPALAGCLGGADDPATMAAAAAEPDGATDAAAADAPVPVDGGRGATAEELGHLPHLHDYWLGRERVTLFEGTVEPSADEAMSATVYRVFVEKQPMAGGTGFSFPEGSIVFEGTGRLHVTAVWSDPTVTSLGFSYRSAAGSDFSDVMPLASGEPTTVEVTPEMTDLPHSTTSRWTFVFSPSEPGAALGAFDLLVEAEKVRDIVAFPGHPDVFGDESVLLLHDAAHEFDEVSYAQRTPDLILTGGFSETLVTPETPVPLDTAWMRVEVDVTEATAMPGEVVGIKFFVQSADEAFVNYPYFKPVEGSFAEKRLVYEFPVTPAMTDSPYAMESQWRLFVEPQTSFTGVDGPSGGMTNTHIAFTLRVYAYNAEREGPASESVERGG